MARELVGSGKSKTGRSYEIWRDISAIALRCDVGGGVRGVIPPGTQYYCVTTGEGTVHPPAFHYYQFLSDAKKNWEPEPETPAKIEQTVHVIHETWIERMCYNLMDPQHMDIRQKAQDREDGISGYLYCIQEIGGEIIGPVQFSKVIYKTEPEGGRTVGMEMLCTVTITYRGPKMGNF